LPRDTVEEGILIAYAVASHTTVQALFTHWLAPWAVVRALLAARATFVLVRVRRALRLAALAPASLLGEPNWRGVVPHGSHGASSRATVSTLERVTLLTVSPVVPSDFICRRV
jgi:hypothetical protein